MTVAVTNPPGAPDDCLAFAPVSSPSTNCVDYLDVASPSWTLSMPQTPDDYEFRLFLDNSYTLEAVSETVSSQ